MEFRIFSKRYERPLLCDQFILVLSKKIRQRLWFALDDHNESIRYHPYPGDSWTENTDILTEVEKELLRQYGIEKFTITGEDDRKVSADLHSVVIDGDPVQSFDIMESAYNQMSDDNKLSFQKTINIILEEEEIPWRLADGHFFKMDTSMLTKDIIIETSELLKAHGFEGALEEYKEARSDFTAGNYKGAIHNSCKSFESVLKALCENNSGNASTLIRELYNLGFYNDIPNEIGNAFGNSVLMALPFIRNKLGGHGQGVDVIIVSKEYAELSIHIAGSFILFLIQHHLKISGQEHISDKAKDNQDDDLPF